MRVDSIDRCPAWAWIASNAIPASRNRVKAGVAQLVAREPLDPGSVTCAGEETVTTRKDRRNQRLKGCLPLSDHEISDLSYKTLDQNRSTYGTTAWKRTFHCSIEEHHS
jgi:hypothetical protein